MTREQRGAIIVTAAPIVLLGFLLYDALHVDWDVPRQIGFTITAVFLVLLTTRGSSSAPIFPSRRKRASSSPPASTPRSAIPSMSSARPPSPASCSTCTILWARWYFSPSSFPSNGFVPAPKRASSKRGSDSN